MLKVFRENLRRLAWILWLVIAVFVLLVFAEVNFNTGETSRTATAVTIGDEQISYARFQQEYNTLENRFRQAYGDAYTPELAKQIGLPQQAVNSLVGRQIMLQEAHRAGLRATDQEIQDAIVSLPVFQDERGNFVGESLYRQTLQRNRLGVDEFERSIREQILLQKFNTFMTDSVWVPDDDARRSAREQAETASIRYVQLGADQVSDPGTLSDAELEAYYDEHRADYTAPERRGVAYLAVNHNVIRASLDIPEEDLRADYEANLSDYTTEEQVRARHILLFAGADRTAEEAQQELESLKARIEEGASFADLAREHSEDEATASRGGDLGFFPRGQMTAAFENAAFAAETGEIVGPIENQLGPRTGFHLIQVEARREGGVQEFEQVQNRIRVRLLNERARETAEQRANEIFQQLDGREDLTADALRALAEAEGFSVETPEPFGREDNIPGIGRNPAFTTAVFGLESGEAAEPVRIAAGWAIPVVTEIDPSRIPELAEVRDQVEADALQERKAELAVAQLAEAKAALESGTTTLDQVAARHGVAVTESAGLRAGGAVTGLGQAPEVVQTAMQLEEGAFGGPVKTPQGAVLFEVVGRTHWDPESFAATRDETLDQLRSQRANALLQSLVEQRRAALDIRLDPQLIETFEMSTPSTGR